MRGSVFKVGNRYAFAVRVPTPDNPATQLKRSGFTRRKDAEAALERVNALLAVPRPNDHRTRAKIGEDVITRTRRRGADDLLAALPSEDETRRRYGARIDPSAPSMTVGEFLDRWLDGRRKIRETTRQAHAGYIRSYLRPHLGDVPLDELTADHIDTMLNWIEDHRGISPASLRQVFAVLRAALNAAVKRRLIPFNPCQQVELPEVVPTERLVWTPAQVVRFLEASATDRHAAAYRVVLLGGLRRGEVAALRWADVNWDAGRLRVERQLVHLHGGLVVTPTKTGRARVVSLDGETVEVLRRHRKAQLEEKLVAGPAYEDEDWMFARADGSMCQPKTLAWRFQELSREAGLPVIHLHDLRHLSATLDLLAGTDIKVVSKRLGHARTAITQDLYQHVLDAMQDQAAEGRAALLEHPAAGSG